MQLQIRHKLFLVILLANLVLAIALSVAVSWNFSRSFQDYIRADQAEEVQPLLLGLAEAYRQYGGQWNWLTDDQRQWQQLLQQYLGQQKIPGEAADQSPSVDRQRGVIPRPPRRHPMARHLLLRDAQNQQIIAPPSLASQEPVPAVQWLPIESDGERVGDLGVIHPRELARQMDRLFVQHLLRQSAWIVLGVLLVSACLAFPFSRRLVRPVTRLQQSMQRLAGGHLEKLTPLPVTTGDELGQLAHAFNLLAETLKENLRARQQWVADISHELRTPVAILKGELEALIDGVRPLEPAALDSLQAEVERLTRLINDLNELSLADQGALSYQREPISLINLLTDFFDDSRAQLEEKGIDLEFEPPVTDRELIVFADESRLVQLFRNLLSNTLRYTEAGGRLRVTVTRKGQALTLRWDDSAPGVSGPNLDRLFERLYRTDDARDRVSGGSGLGLAICRSIAEAHQGRIEASHSELGGLAVVVQLPLYR
ncbi:ATP-binding protein [Marinobacter sp. CHS3-4]|uniref:ATP-binding protein n=1 Tax=Marinobacter sp. CHS3-4 TaxID=3045174 RepID=UPI0024B4EB96|nr:ATP-binding protein [Marinobacter sp. CHS3-4]MDI9244632.1 ATP-binding protein [Marinobacter sp. CHS3-4]